MNFQKIIKDCEKWVLNIYTNGNHLVRTGYWVRRLDENASPELVIACVTHDIERAFPQGREPRGSSETGAGVNWEDKAYNLWHGKRSAKIVGEFLVKKGMDKKFIAKVKRLIVVHEMGGTYEENLIKDADSISFLEINGPLFISWIPKKYTANQVREKFDYMYNRITLPKANNLAKPFYESSLKKLDNLKTF
jgi:hypothetical protein